MESNYQKLHVWQKAIDLVGLIYKITADFPKEEMYGLASQMRRCAVSIPSNIAEGSQRGTKKDFKYFLLIAKGSTAELETQLILANNLGYIQDQEKFIQSQKDTLEVRRMLSGLIA